MTADGVGLSSVAYEAAPLLLALERSSKGQWELRSSWCNLGLWSTACTRFSAACAELARLLAVAAQLTAADEVLDVGVGYGEQVRLWLDEYGVKRVVALENSKTVAAAARAALADKPAATIICGDAGHLSDTGLTAQPASFDVVLCLDCAYHFATREAFIASAVPLLRPAGRFAAVDLIPTKCRSRWSFMFFAQRLVAVAVGIPWSNLYGAEEYMGILCASGLTAAQVQPIESPTFARLGAYAWQQKDRLRKTGDLTWKGAVMLSGVGVLMNLSLIHI